MGHDIKPGFSLSLSVYLFSRLATAQNRLIQLRKLNGYVVLLMYSVLQALLSSANFAECKRPNTDCKSSVQGNNACNRIANSQCDAGTDECVCIPPFTPKANHKAYK